MAFTIQSVRLPTGDCPVVGVVLEPYVLIKRGDTTVTADDVPEEGSGEGVYQLRTRWFRSSIARGGNVCSVHPDKEATVQCTVCLRSKVAQHLSYHCSPECFKSNWVRHVDYHMQALANGTMHAASMHCQPGRPSSVTHPITCHTGAENVYEQGSVRGSIMSTGETWVEVRRDLDCMPCMCMQAVPRPLGLQTAMPCGWEML